MKEKQESFQEIVDRWCKEWDTKYGKFELRKEPTIRIDREIKPLCRIPRDTDFTLKDGNTEYEVVGHFNENTDAYLINQILRRLRNAQN